VGVLTASNSCVLKADRLQARYLSRAPYSRKNCQRRSWLRLIFERDGPAC